MNMCRDERRKSHSAGKQFARTYRVQLTSNMERVVLAFVFIALGTVAASECKKLNEEKRCVPDCPPQKACANKDIKVNCLQKATEVCKDLCVCKNGYFRNPGGECVTEDDCTKCGGQNEYFSNRGRPDVTCASLGTPATDEQDQIAQSNDGQCSCSPGTARDENNVCVPYDQCNKPCGVEETKDYCPADCLSDYCPKNEKIVSCPRPKTCPPPQCKCRFNTRRADNGTCIPTRECPPFKCTKPFEEYNPCPPLCPNGYCAQATPSGRCPQRFGIIGIVLECSPACRCKSGYYWNGDKICVPFNQCPGKSDSTTDTE